jgi:hypothetical protein
MERILSWLRFHGEMQQIIVESVFVVAHPAFPIHGEGDPQEMIQELGGKVLIRPVVSSQFRTDFKHALAKSDIQAVPSASQHRRNSIVGSTAY